MTTRPRPPDADFADHCCELLGSVGACRSRRMFGGHGLYHDDLMFGLIAGEQLYLKVDAQSLPSWRDAGGCPFEYGGAPGKKVTMNYWTPPPEALESPVLMAPWARLAFDAALRARAGKIRKPRRGAT